MRDHNLDILRGIGIIFVVLGHVIEGIMQAGLCHTVVLPDLYHTIYSFHMPLLFFVSGCTSCLSAGKTTVSWKNRLFHDLLALYIPYVLFSYIFLFIKVFLYQGAESVQASALVDAWILPETVYWFLLALLVIRLLSHFLHSFFSNTIVFLISFLLLILGSHPSMPNYFCLKDACHYLICFEAGYLIYASSTLSARLKGGIIALCCIPLCICFISSIDGTTYYPKIIIGLCVSVLLYILIASLPFHPSWLTHIGCNTLIIYLIHPFLTGPVRTIFTRFFTNDIVLVLLETLLLIIVPLCITYAYQHIKCFHWIQYVFYPYRLLGDIGHQKKYASN